MSIRSRYVTRSRMLDAAKWCFYRDAPIVQTLRETIIGKSHDQMRAEEIINAAFDARDYGEIPFIVIESGFRNRGEGALINDLIAYLDPASEVR